MVVAPCRCAAARTSSYGVRTTATRRRGPVGCTSEQSAIRGGRHPPPAPMEALSSRQEPRTPATALAFATRASVSRLAGEGRGRGAQSGWLTGPGSTRSARMVRPPTPSASTWWSTTTRAARPPGSAPTRLTDHSGASRRSGLVTNCSAVSMSACSSPGAPQSTSRTCCLMSNAPSSTQTGPPQPNGTDASRCRSRGTACIRSATRLRTRGSDRGPSSSRTTPNCSGTCPLSIARKARSEALARSIGAARTGAGAGACGWLVTPMPPANASCGEPGRVQGHRRAVGRPAGQSVIQYRRTTPCSVS